MTEYLIQESTLTGLADAVRTKMGVTDKLTLSQIIDYVKNCSGASETPIGEKLYSFGVLSDIHLRADNYQNGIDDFDRAISYVQQHDVDFVGIAGDLGHANTADELELYKTALDTYASVPFYIVRGNHDVKHTEDAWEQYTGYPSNFDIVHNGDVFLFLSRDISTDMSNTQAEPYTEGLVWVKEQLEKYKGARIFLFIHYPPSGYSGLRDGQYYGFSSASTQDDELISAINQTKNVIVFHGHTHYKLQVEETYDNINIYRFNASKTALIHVPSCAYPRDENSNVVGDLSQGYIVDVYKQGVVLRGIDLTTGALMPEYEYAVMVDHAPEAITNAIICRTKDISLDAGESAQVEVYMTMGEAVVNVSANNSNVTVSPETLTFTPENYATPQLVTITAADSIGNNATSVITLSADGLISKTISVTLNEIPLTTIVSGSNQIVDGAAYGGTYTGSTLNFPNSGSFNIKFVNLNMSYSNAPVLMKGNPITGTINVYGDNTLVSTNSRGISSSSTTPINLIGVGNGASLLAKGGSGATVVGFKGDWNVTNLDLIIETAATPITIISKGITIIGNGSVTMNTAKVEVLASEHGTLSVNLGAATAGSSAITITSTPDSGYKLSSILINGIAGSATQTMPAVGETMTIQGVFVIDDGA